MERSKKVCNDAFSLRISFESFWFSRTEKKPSTKTWLCFLFNMKNLDMAYDARRAMDGQIIGKAECRIGYGV